MNTPKTTTLDSAAARKSGWLRTTLWLLLVLCVAMLVTAFAALDQLDAAPLLISVNGTPLVTDLGLAALPPAHKVVLALGVALVLLVALFVALGGVAVALIALVPIVLLAVALPVLLASAIVLLVLSPFLLIGWLLWRAARPAPRSTTMSA
jgi:hypothetical protein